MTGSAITLLALWLVLSVLSLWIWLPAGRGPGAAVRTTRRTRIAVLAAMVVLATVRRCGPRTIFCVFIACLFPLIVELINTAAETIIDFTFGPAYREDVRDAKDMLSAAVFLSLAVAYGLSLMLIFF